MERGYEERQLADRFSTYCDAIAAVSLVNALAFFIAIAEQEVRCSLVDHRLLVVLGGAAIQMAYMAALVTFRRAEVASVRRPEPPCRPWSASSSGDSTLRALCSWRW